MINLQAGYDEVVEFTLQRRLKNVKFYTTQFFKLMCETKNYKLTL